MTWLYSSPPISHLKRLLSFLFTKGKTYHIQNNFLNIHALVPSTADGEFEEFLGRKGKDLLNFIQETIARVGKNYLQAKNSAKKIKPFSSICGAARNHHFSANMR